MKKIIVSVLLFGLINVGLINVVSAAQPVSESHKQAALELLKTMKMGEQFSGALETGIDAQLRANPSMIRYRQVFLDFYEKYVNWEDVKDRFALLYTNNFTEQELKEINQFFSTKTGQKVATSTTKLMEQGMKLGEELVRENQDELMRMMQEADQN